MAEKTQTATNHVRLLPPFHFFVLPVLFLNVLYALWRIYSAPSLGTAWFAVVAAALLMLGLLSRLQVLTVQDRLIRLEMRLRLRELLPAAMHARIKELTPKQLVAMRFASDAELPDLTREVLEGKLPTPKEIKMRVRHWEPDYLRA